MKQMTIAYILIILSATSSSGETVRFDPPVQTVDLHSGSTTTTFDVYVENTGDSDTFDAIDMLIGSDTLILTDFTFEQNFLLATGIFSNITPFDGQAGYLYAIFTGGFSFVPFTRPTFIGTVTVDIGQLGEGDYFVEVNVDKDNGLSKIISEGVTENLFGSATVSVVTLQPGSCISDTDCNDSDECTDDLCDQFACTNIAIEGCNDSSVPPSDGNGMNDPDPEPVDMDNGMADTSGDSGDDPSPNFGSDQTGGAATLPSLCGVIGMISFLMTLMGLTAMRGYYRRKF